MLPDLEGVPIFDGNMALELLEHDRELLRDVTELFHTSSRRLLSEVEHAVERSDPEAVSRAAHSLKGAAANVCAERIRVLSLALETSGRERRLGDFAPILEALRVSVAEFEHATRALA